MYVYQCWCWEDWCVYYSEHRSGKDEVWRSGRPLPDRQDSPNSETGYGADRGISVMQGRSSQGRSHKQHIKEYNTSFWFSPNNNISWLYLYLQIQKATQHCGFISICADTIHVSMAPPARAINKHVDRHHEVHRATQNCQLCHNAQLTMHSADVYWFICWMGLLGQGGTTAKFTEFSHRFLFRFSSTPPPYNVSDVAFRYEKWLCLKPALYLMTSRGQSTERKSNPVKLCQWV